MNINQHNYQEIFLLYADGELNHADMHAVDRFVEANPLLIAEFEEILSLKISPEEITFHNKEALLKGSQISISESNQDSYFMLYQDGELAPTEKLATETYLLANPMAQLRFDQFANAILPIEHIEYPEKSSLYRFTEKKKPLVYLSFQKYAVAAVFLGLLLFSYFLWDQPAMNQLSNPASPLLSDEVTPKKNKPETASNPALSLNNFANNSRNNSRNNNRNGNTNRNITNSNVNSNITNKNTNSNKNTYSNFTNSIATITASTKMPANDIASVWKPTNRLPAEVSGIEKQNIRNTANSLHTEETSIQAAAIASEASTTNDELGAETKPLDSADNYAYLETDEEDRTFTIGNIELNKDKFRGLVRKAGSIFKTKKNTDK